MSLSIEDKYILRYYQNIREDIAIFDDIMFIKNQNTIKDDFKKIAKEYRYTFEYDALLERGPNKREVFNFLRGKIEEEGIYVFKNNKGDRGQNKGLSNNLQGCIFLDNELPPLVLINSEYPENAQTSTLLHEFAHYLLGESVIEVEENFNKNEVEKWGNRFAYHFMIDEKIEKEENFNIQNIKELSKTYFVSKASFMVRFKELQKIDKKQYDDFFNQPFNDTKKDTNRKKGSGGGNYHNTKRERFSKRFLRILSGSLAEGRISQSEFAKYIGIKDQKCKDYII